jgi:hypothetical protein
MIDVAAQVGLDFRHEDGRSGAKYFIETAASGGGFLDFDGDGDLDVYLVNGGATPGSRLSGTPHDRLFENRGGRLVDVTDRAGVGHPGYGMGLCAGDFDGDGGLDFLVTSYGPDRLYRNLGDGRFEEIGARAGVADTRWSTSCAFGDVDRDGDLDLYVARYVDFRFDKNPFCGDRARNLRSYCRPDVFDGVDDALYVNRGDGTFRDEAAERGIARGPTEKGFGVVMTDLDADGDLDIYVANDGTMNRLYVNDGRGRFHDRALLAGAGYDATGRAKAGMGVDVGDADGDGRPDVFVTNYSMETNSLFRQSGPLSFEEVADATGLGEPSYRYVGWGTRFLDYDNDGDLDVAVVNGHPIDNIELFESKLSHRQPSQLFENDGRGRFRQRADVSAAWRRPRPSRGLAVGDWNDDGRLDLLVTNTNDRANLFENRLQTDNHWLGLALVGPPANRHAIGALARVTLPGRTLAQEVRSGGSFLSQSDLRLHFGLGRHAGPVTVEVRWPDGRVQREAVAVVDRYATIRYSGTPAPSRMR